MTVGACLASLRLAVRSKYRDFLELLATVPKALPGISRLVLVLALCASTACVTAADRNKSNTRVDLAKDLIGKGQDAAAEEELRKALALDPNNEEAHFVYGILYVVRAARATDLVERENCLKGAEAEALHKEADDAMRKADEAFVRAVTLAEDYGEAWMSRCVVALHFDDYDKAIEFCTKALANSGRLTSAPLARTNLGWALHHRKDDIKATTELLQAVQATPNLCLARYRLAQVYFDRSEFEEADAQIAMFAPQGNEAAICSPPVVEALYLGGEVRVRAQDPAGAVSWFQRCIEASPRSCVARRCQKALAELGGGP